MSVVYPESVLQKMSFCKETRKALDPGGCHKVSSKYNRPGIHLVASSSDLQNSRSIILRDSFTL